MPSDDQVKQSTSNQNQMELWKEIPHKEKRISTCINKQSYNKKD